MDMLPAVITLGGLGAVFGIGLGFASRIFCVATDPRLERIFSHLPGANCGACGMPGCMGFAEGLIEGTCTVERCPVTQDEAKKEIARIMGIEVKDLVKTSARLACNGGAKVKDKFSYRGLSGCQEANLVMAGPKSCVYGCIGLGTCINVCPFSAITMNSENIPVVDKDLCKACNKCVEACPKGLFSLIPKKAKVYVSCKSHDLGKDTKTACPVGCIGCRICEKTCKFDAIHIIDNLAVIDYNKCTSCAACVRSCPTKAIRTI